jgi:acetylserotonin O-methyltransferase
MTPRVGVDETDAAPAAPMDAQPLWDLIEGFRRSKTMFAAVSVGVFEGVRPPDETGRRLLDACVALGLLAKRDGGYINTPLANEYLRNDSRRSLCGYVAYSNHVLYRLWDGLDQAFVGADERSVTARRKRARRIFLKHTQDFIDGMRDSGKVSFEAIVANVDLSRFSRLVDLGGGAGHLAKAAKERYRHLEVAVMDLPRVTAAAAREYGDEVVAVAGDFMRDALPPADLFAIGRVLHNLSEADVRQLLERIYAATPSGGAILIAETLLERDTSSSISAHLQDLNMLICTQGRERTADEYARLLEDVGYRIAQIVRPGMRLDAILAEKPHRRVP